MGFFKKIKIKAPKIKIKAPKAVSNLGKKIEKGVSNVARETGKGALKAVAEVKKGATNIGREGLVGYGNVMSETGKASGVKEIENVGKNVSREVRSGADPFLGAAFDIGANALSAGTYGMAQTAANALASGDLKSLTSSKGLQDLAMQQVGSKLGIDPKLLSAGTSALSGDLKSAALKGLGSYAGLDPKQLQMASTGISALTGDTSGLVSGVASQLGAGNTAANMLGAAAGGNKSDLISSLGGQLGLDPKMTNMLGAVASGDIKGAALSQLAGATGLDPKLLDNLSQGKIDPMQIANAVGVNSSSLLNGAADKLGISSFTKSPEAKAALDFGKSAGRVVTSVDPYVKDPQNAALDAAAATLGGGNTYKIAKGDTLSSIAQKMGVDPKALAAANNITDPNKIVAGMNLKMPTTLAQRKEISDQNAIKNTDRGTSIWDDIKGGVSSGLGAASNFLADNKTALGMGADAAGAYLGYRAGQDALSSATRIKEQQLAQLQSVGKDYEAQRYDPNRYEQENKFLQQRVAGGGITEQERKIQQEGDIRSARAAAAQRLAGVDTQARLGGAAMGTSALASSLSGAQAGQNIQAETNLAREASASQRLEQDIQRQTNLARQKTAEEAALAQSQATFGLQRANQTGEAREGLANIEERKGAALQNLYRSGADLIKAGLSQTETPQEKQQREQKQEYDRKMAEAELKAKQNTAGITTPPVSNLNTKAGGAKIVSNNPPNLTVTQPTTVANQGSFGVLQSDKAKEADKFNNWGTVGTNKVAQR